MISFPSSIRLSDFVLFVLPATFGEVESTSTRYAPEVSATRKTGSTPFIAVRHINSHDFGPIGCVNRHHDINTSLIDSEMSVLTRHQSEYV